MIGHASKVQGRGVKLNVREWSRDKPVTILLVHGYPDSSHIWDATAEQLAQHFHVVAYDVRGAGQSETPKRTRDYSLAHLSADFRAVLDAVSPHKPVHVIAHDWGSIQTWESVCDPTLHSRIASYTSISGPCLDHVGFWMRDRLGSGRWRAPLHQVLHSWYVIAFQLPLLGPALWRAGLGRLWPHLISRMEDLDASHCNPTQTEDGRHGVGLYRANFIPRLLAPRNRPTRVPVQLLVPTGDPFVSVELFDDLHRWVPNLRRIDIDAGHWLPLSAPELLANHAKNFIDDIENSRESAAPADSTTRELRA